MNADRPLSDAQERNLIVLGDRTASPDLRVNAPWPAEQPDGWIYAGQYWTRANTLESLERLGLARSSVSGIRFSFRYQITEAGLIMLRSMGD